jgi:hypothetical protein
MKGRTGTIREYRKRSVNSPIATVQRIKIVLLLHLRPAGHSEYFFFIWHVFRALLQTETPIVSDCPRL